MLVISVFLIHVLGASANCDDCVEPSNIELYNSADVCAGSVRVSIDGVGGSVIDSQWDMNDAAVVCRELNCGVPLSAPVGSAYGPLLYAKAFMTDVQCTGEEENLAQCRYSRDIPAMYDHNRDAAVHCSGPDVIRLVNGPDRCSGRVEIRRKGVWGTVCADFWDYNEASVACRQLRCGAAKRKIVNPTFGKSSLPVLVHRVRCQGDEESLWHCNQQGCENTFCFSQFDAGVTCEEGPEEIRLVNTGDACKGRVEIKHENRWGTICDTLWNLNAAEVICRQLECGSALRVEVNNNVFGKGLLPVWLGFVKCNGDERSLFDCSHEIWGNHICISRRDSGVECTGTRIFDPTIYKESVSLDRKTAHPTLDISVDGKRIKNRPTNPGDPVDHHLFDGNRCVLGSSGFTSGKHYWEIRTTLLSYRPYFFSLSMNVGVARQSVKTNKFLSVFPDHVFWTMAECPTCFEASFYSEKPTFGFNLEFNGNASKVTFGLYLDYEAGLISFYNADTRAHIHTMSDTLTGKVFPIFCTHDNVELELV